VEDLAEERYHDLREHVASLEGMLEKERAKDLLKLRTVSVASSDLAAPRDRKLSVASSDIDDLPPRQRAILEQVEQQGWDSVSWRDGYTMLHWAASKGKVDLLRRLLPLNGDPDAVDKFDRTALQCAEEAHHSEAAEFLRRHTRPKTEKLVRSSKKHQTAFPATTSTSAYVSSVAGRRPSEPTLEQMRSQSKGTELPELYLPVLDEIQRIGWSNMKWAHGFTLLHWAAKNNNPELIERFSLRVPTHCRRTSLEGLPWTMPETLVVLQLLLHSLSMVLVLCKRGLSISGTWTRPRSSAGRCSVCQGCAEVLNDLLLNCSRN